MWYRNQTRPDIANAVRAIERFSHHPKPIRCKAVHSIIECLNAASDIWLLFRMDSIMGSVQVESDSETYVDTNYAHKAEDRHSVSGVAASCGVRLFRGFLGRRSTSHYLLLKQGT